ncbi:pantoate--beta-alanine ligase [Sulfuriroseicoccus oceanibius]|uniref:Pantothenate synthetase n=1 Tax=Sulfuriroseicoccus oceanibius TaxID=2707525 RepID=A0A6B3L5I6_9BACT|nr:pantoate--beta-alanine ligase [Sulfuriroseicoccus oceanibius]QQL45060.1 pantoate--beta-alanine ligase [Sulfuriroseicoccus oceanibius]
MEVCRTIVELRQAIARRRAAGRVVLVPTMGALHRGHGTLIEEGRDLAGNDGVLVVSIFVNPTQFGEGEDFEDYPRDLERDGQMCDELGVDLIFAPQAKEMYAGDHSIRVRENSVSQHLCGESRPGHFSGVCTVVAKLFNIVQPDIAVFGKKDAQQLAIIRRMVRDLNFPVEIVGVETVREFDGLAMSSRNAYLDSDHREQAPLIREALATAEELFFKGETRASILIGVAEKIISQIDDSRIDYIKVVDADSFQPLERITDDALMAVAVFVGDTRLIDNVELPINECMDAAHVGSVVDELV